MNSQSICSHCKKFNNCKTERKDNVVKCGIYQPTEEYIRIKSIVNSIVGEKRKTSNIDK